MVSVGSSVYSLYRDVDGAISTSRSRAALARPLRLPLPSLGPFHFDNSHSLYRSNNVDDLLFS